MAGNPVTMVMQWRLIFDAVFVGEGGVYGFQSLGFLEPGVAFTVFLQVAHHFTLFRVPSVKCM